MNFKSIFEELKNCGTEQNIKVYRKHGAKGDLFGVSFANLKKLKASITPSFNKKGINHRVAQQLWQTRNIDARILACMVADPIEITRNEANHWVADIQYYVLADYFAELIAQTKFGLDIMYLWIQSPDEYIKRVGFAILNFIARNDDDKSELFFHGFLMKIKQELHLSPNRAKEAMNNCLIAIGGRTQNLREKVIEVAESLGEIEIDHGDTSCKTFIIKEYLDKMWERKK